MKSATLQQLATDGNAMAKAVLDDKSDGETTAELEHPDETAENALHTSHDEFVAAKAAHEQAHDMHAKTLRDGGDGSSTIGHLTKAHDRFHAAADGHVAMLEKALDCWGNPAQAAAVHASMGK